MMKQALILIIALLAPTARAAQTASTPADEPLVRKIVEDLVTARNAQDIKALGQLYADDAQFIGYNGDVASGKASSGSFDQTSQSKSTMVKILQCPDSTSGTIF